MDFRKHNFILTVTAKLHQHGSWTGKTHVQKTLFLLDAATPIKPPFEFVLYKHGPYSFDVERELAEMKSYAAITSEPAPEGYGVVLNIGDNAEFVRQRAPLTPEEERAIECICEFIGTKNVTELERLATAAWIRSREGIQEPQRVASRLHELKPHVSASDAAQADKELFALLCR